MQDPRLFTLFPARRPEPSPSVPELPSYALMNVIPYYRAPETFWTPDRTYLRAPGNKRYVNANYQVVTDLSGQH